MKGRFAFPKNLPLSDDVKELITRMLHRDPAKRMTIPEVQRAPVVPQESIA